MNTQIAEPKSRSPWLLAGGGTIIILGLVFLVENLTQTDLDDLWAVALLPLTLAAIAQARHIYVNAGKLTGTAVGWIVIGLSTSLVALVLIFSLDFGELWPVFFIIGGAGVLLAAWR